MSANNEKTKHINLLFIIILCTTLFTACGGANSDSDEKTYSPTTIAMMSHVINASEIQAPYTCMRSLDEKCRTQLTKFYGFDEAAIDTISDITIVRTDGVSSEEYFIVKTTDITSVKELLNRHVEVRTGDFIGYAPDEAEKLSNACVVTKGGYVGMFISKDSKACRDAFYESITTELVLNEDEEAVRTALKTPATEESTTEEPTTENPTTEEPTTEKLATEEPTTTESDSETTSSAFADLSTEKASTEEVLVEEIYWMDPYDTSMILEAYQTGNENLLTNPMDVEVLHKCIEIISEVITEDMTDYEKELAIHDYIIEHADYDENALIYSDWFTQYADQPYGTLIDGNAICLGYASSFKLLLNMLGIECLFIKGDVYDTYVYHAWNLVKLGTNWYAVDVTWDDPVNQHTVSHKYFNVTDTVLINSGHHLTHNGYPAATGGPYEGYDENQQTEPNNH